MVDSEVIASVQKGDRTAFKAMYQQCITYVYSIVRRYVASTSDHPDVIQEIFARLFLSAHTFDANKGNFKSWLRRVTINECLKYVQKGKPFREYLPMDDVEEPKSRDNLKVHELSKAEIEAYLGQMPDGYRQIFMLSVIDEYTHQEISEMLDISPDTSRSQLSRAKSWFRKHLLNDKQKTLTIGL